MPMYFYVCEDCGTFARRLRAIADGNTPLECVCKGKMPRSPQPPDTSKVEVLDNGAMRRRLERPADAERLIYERNAAYEAEKKKT